MWGLMRQNCNVALWYLALTTHGFAIKQCCVLLSMFTAVHGQQVKYVYVSITYDLPVHNVLVAKYPGQYSGCKPGHVMRWPERSGWKHHAGVRIDGQGDGVVEVHVVQPPRVCLQQWKGVHVNGGFLTAPRNLFLLHLILHCSSTDRQYM
jgi:hypothetical protein